MKSVAQDLAVQHEVTPPSMRILRIASCPSLSGKSSLTYHVGCTPDADIAFRVFGNTGGGLFSNEWVTLEAIQQIFAKVPSMIAITAHLLGSLYLGKSVNTPSFLFAVLKGEGLVAAVTDKKGCYERTDPSVFIAEVEALIASSVDLKAEEKPLKTGTPQLTGKPPSKPKAQSEVKPTKGKPRGKQ